MKHRIEMGQSNNRTSKYAQTKTFAMYIRDHKKTEEVFPI